jgi:transposase
MHESLFMENLRKKVVEAVGRRMNRSEAAYLFGISLSSVKRVTLGWSLPSST